MKTIDLIESLSKDAASVKTQKPIIMFTKWFLFSAIYMGLMLMLFGVRVDIYQKLQNSLFLAEIASLLAICVTVGIASIILSYPDNYQKRYLIYLPVLPLMFFIITLIKETQAQLPLHEDNIMLGCFLCICLFAIGPGLLFFRQLINNASTSPGLASAMGVLAAFSFGTLVVRLCEQVDSMAHIIGFHYLPLLLLSGIGMLVGRKLLKW